MNSPESRAAQGAAQPTPSSPHPHSTYKAAGVDIHAGYDVVRRIKAHAASTHRPEVLQGIGSFGSFFALDTAKYKDPVLVSGTDGVGTKLKIAFMTGVHNTIGIDAVAYCVNDILCQGAEPLFFLDYIALWKTIPELVEQIVAGVAEGCRQAGCALVGGETAEMPGFYSAGEYDLAGFAVGAVDRADVIDGSRVRPGDVVIGLASTGLQSSGYSLVRHILFGRHQISVETHVPEFGHTWGEELLKPTGIYARALGALRRAVDVRGIANISGGGLPENVPRTLGDGLQARIKKGSWPVPPVFTRLQQLGEVDDAELAATFNLGVGMVAIVAGDQADAAVRTLAQAGTTAWPIGEIETGTAGLVWS
ncbi:MAG TPA: phosphoribosylformylglycinamidine cyclo-ligase [Limnochordia bacterium]|nr:phosphoribosylformylglycinamidine cyclo-ligase [Limnochordia bacterium]